MAWWYIGKIEAQGATFTYNKELSRIIIKIECLEEVNTNKIRLCTFVNEEEFIEAVRTNNITNVTWENGKAKLLWGKNYPIIDGSSYKRISGAEYVVLNKVGNKYMVFNTSKIQFGISFMTEGNIRKYSTTFDGREHGITSNEEIDKKKSIINKLNFTFKSDRVVIKLKDTLCAEKIIMEDAEKYDKEFKKSIDTIKDSVFRIPGHVECLNQIFGYALGDYEEIVGGEDVTTINNISCISDKQTRKIVIDGHIKSNLNILCYDNKFSRNYVKEIWLPNAEYLGRVYVNSARKVNLYISKDTEIGRIDNKENLSIHRI